MKESKSQLGAKDRFMNMVEMEPNSGCWLWSGYVTKWGYGAFRHNGKTLLSHRVSYSMHVGEIPAGMLACHKCDVPSCVNPDHLFLGSQTDNMQDMLQKGRFVPSRGQKNGCAKLTENDVLAIRSASGISQKCLARKFGVSPTLISVIRSNKAWKHLRGAA